MIEEIKKALELKKSTQYTHMPFMSMINGGMLFICCLADKEKKRITVKLVDEMKLVDSSFEYHEWKTHYWDKQSNEFVPFNLPFPEGSFECSPIIWQDYEEETINFSVVVTSWGDEKKQMTSTLYNFSGSSLKEMLKSKPELIRQAREGFCNTHICCVSMPNAKGNNQVLVQELKKYTKYLNKRLFIFSVSEIFDTIYRLAYIDQDPHKVIITGSKGGKYLSVLYDINSHTSRRILVEGHDVYKCSIYSNWIAYAEKTGEDFEARNIRFSDQIEYVQLDIAPNVYIPKLKNEKCCGNKKRKIR